MSISTDRTRLVVGCMTGTSIDALDVALVRVRGSGLGMTAEYVRMLSHPLGTLASALRSIAEQHPTTAGEIARVSREFSLLHAKAIGELLRGERCDLLSVHGQTIFHSPPLSWQLFNGPVLAHALNTPVVTDLRAADLACGGQGAPITPLADWIFFRSDRATAIVNLGGFCNITLLPPLPSQPNGTPADIDGFDVCACNHVLDQLARTLLGKPFDEDGRAAREGTIHAGALDDLNTLLGTQSLARRSLGTGDETAGWIERWRAVVVPKDLCATACEALGTIIGRRTQGAPRVLLAGGGVRNAALVGAITRRAGGSVQRTDDAGLPADAREAAEIAVLGALCADRVPITLPRVTHVPVAAPIAGVWSTP